MTTPNLAATTATIATDNTILRSIVGSRLHGLALEGQDDRDEMGICVEPPQYVIGLRRFEHYTYRSQPEGVRSGPGDLDLTIYSLRKYARLALNGNPTVLLLLFAPQQFLLIQTEIGRALQDLAHCFISRRAAQAFLGYLTTQKERLTNERGQKRTRRPELVEAHGYDSKYASHAYRLGIQGIELLQSGRITLPMPQPWRGMALEIRTGAVRYPVAIAAINELTQQLTKLLNTSSLPENPDFTRIDRFLIEAYHEHWRHAQTIPWTPGTPRDAMPFHLRLLEPL